MNFIAVVGFVAVIAVIIAFVISSHTASKYKPTRKVVHCMLDLETFALDNNAYIRSVGAVFFDEREVGNRFYATCDGSDQPGSVTEEATKKWWADQTEAAKAALTNTRGLTLDNVLESFAAWCSAEVAHYEKSFKTVELWVWGNGADFDPVILGNAYRRQQIPAPWKWYNVRCYRTLKNLFRGIEAGDFKGEKHNAVADAAHQGRHASAILNHIYNR